MKSSTLASYSNRFDSRMRMVKRWKTTKCSSRKSLNCTGTSSSAHAVTRISRLRNTKAARFSFQPMWRVEVSISMKSRIRFSSTCRRVSASIATESGVLHVLIPRVFHCLFWITWSARMSIRWRSLALSWISSTMSRSLKRCSEILSISMMLAWIPCTTLRV